jgi:hypothetical protein
MGRTRLTLFLCQGKACRKAWGKLTDSAPGKWLRRQLGRAGLPYKLRVVKTGCQDRCDDAAAFCCVCGPAAEAVRGLRSAGDADRALAALRACAERAAAGAAAAPARAARRPR